MFIHRIRKLTVQETAALGGRPYWGYCCLCAAEFVPVTHRAMGTEAGYRVAYGCCAECAAEYQRTMIRERVPATPVTHGEADETYDGRKDYVSPFLTFQE